MPRLKKRFSCGHRGFGKYCHACEDQKKAYEKSTAEKIEEALAGGAGLKKEGREKYGKRAKKRKKRK